MSSDPSAFSLAILRLDIPPICENWPPIIMRPKASLANAYTREFGALEGWNEVSSRPFGRIRANRTADCPEYVVKSPAISIVSLVSAKSEKMKLFGPNPNTVHLVVRRFILAW